MSDTEHGDDERDATTIPADDARALTRRRWWVWPVAVVGILVSAVAVWIVTAAVIYSPEYVKRVLVWQESDQGDYLNNFPTRTIQASSSPHRFTADSQEDLVGDRFRAIFEVDDFERFLADHDTQAFIVIEGDRVIYERYFNGTSRESMLTSFSVAKSFVSALVGIAIDEGLIGADDPITAHLPELADRDPRFERITIRDLLLMSSGLDYTANRWALFNGDDPLTTYYPDQRALALERSTIIGEPGRVFSYNKYHPQLLGMVLERRTGMSVTEWTQTRLWEPLGMEYDGEWALDRTDGFEKMEAGLNARAIDYAKLGVLYRDDGRFEGESVVSREWVRASVSPDPTRDSIEYYDGDFGRQVHAGGDGYYGYMWYGRLRPEARPDFAAEGDRGQFIYVAPASDLVITRVGTDYGVPSNDWLAAFQEFATVANR